MQTILMVTGDRKYDNYSKIYDNIQKYTPIKIIQGGANGADKLAKKAAKELKIECVQYDADWKTYGKAAGPIRNQEMVNSLEKYASLGYNIIVLGFHDDIEKSKGTKDCLNRARKKFKNVFLL